MNVAREYLPDPRVLQISAIREKLLDGVIQVKEGHRVRDYNPEGQSVLVPMTQTKKLRLQIELAILESRVNRTEIPFELFNQASFKDQLRMLANLSLLGQQLFWGSYRGWENERGFGMSDYPLNLRVAGPIKVLKLDH